MKLQFSCPPLTRDWQNWFAWYPVFCEGCAVAWFETVEYQWDGSGYDPGYNYRLKA